MEIQVNRAKSGKRATLGAILIDGVPTFMSLEDLVRPLGPRGEGKIFGQTAIPAGRYRVTATYSQKFGKVMLLVNDVPFFTGIRFHSLNNELQTEGCIGVGYTADPASETIHGGSQAMPVLFAKVTKALDNKEEVFVTVRNSRV